MEAVKTINTYYKNIIDLVLELHSNELSSAKPGHCMKIIGLGSNELDYLWETVKAKYPKIDTYIILEQQTSDRYISATKLIELRNKEENPLLVLIPSNSRTAAEDSYGNATFKEISLDGIDVKLKEKLISEVPDDFKRIIKDEILFYLQSEKIELSDIVNYLVALKDNGYTIKNVGNYIYNLGLIPDENLIVEEEKTRSRLNFNLFSTGLLSSFNKPLYDRIGELPLEANTLQKEVVNFIKNEKAAKTSGELCKIIFRDYPNLNFSKWQIPDLKKNTDLRLECETITNGDRKTIFTQEEDVYVLNAKTNTNSKLKVRITTNTPPKDIPELYAFRIILMAVNGGSGDSLQDLRLAKNSSSTKPYRDLTFDISTNSVDEGSYFVKVLAEDKNGKVLNSNDDFKDPSIQNKWEENSLDKEFKKSLDYKLACDSDDFRIYIDDEIEETSGETRKDRLNNAIQAYFKFRIQQFRTGEDETIPVPTEESNLWLNDDKERHSSTFHINYSERHNYQINLSTKLRIVETKFLENPNSFGHVKGILKSNSAAIGFESIKFVESEVTSMVPNAILKLREEIFSYIKNSTQDKKGIFETADVFNIQNQIKKYVTKLSEWTSELKGQVASEALSLEEKSKLHHLLTELQFLDLARIKTKLPDGESVEALLLSPLHPLRLSWFLQLVSVFNDWEQKTRDFEGHKDSWSRNYELLFEGELSPENNPLILVEPTKFNSFQYSGELAYGWGFYLNDLTEKSSDGMTSVSRQLKHYFRQLFNITKDNFVETDISQKLVVRHIRNYLIQHPYTDKLIVNLINAGDANVFADALVDLEKERSFKNIKYEVRVFKGADKIIEHGEALKNLINPEFNVSEEAEAFSQPSKNRLFPKLRFSINTINDYLKFPSKFTAHISFLVSPFPVGIELIKPHTNNRNFYLNGLITDSTVAVSENGTEIKWNRFIKGNSLPVAYDGSGNLGVDLFNNIQTFISGALASEFTDDIPATALRLNERDKVLLAHLHDYSDWVVTFDKNLGPEVFDQPSRDGNIPFLLDYVPGEEISGISSYLTTRPTSEILGLLGPHFEEFNLDVHDPNDERKIKILLEDLRAVSSSLVLQLNSSKNKAFEVIGSAFTKRVLEKKGFLNNSFLIPIDLHQNLFENLPSESRSRADNLLVSIDPDKNVIAISVIEIKCRKSLGDSEKNDLKVKMKEQIENTIQALRSHFDPEFQLSFDRLDREIKNKELKSLLSFYIDRAFRYDYLSENAHSTYNDFLQRLDSGFKIRFSQLGLIFDFSAKKRHHKEIVDSDLTFFTFGGKLIEDILDPDSDLNTRRLEQTEFEEEFTEAIGLKSNLKPFIQKFASKRKDFSDSNSTVMEEDVDNGPYKVNVDSSETDFSVEEPKVEEIYTPDIESSHKSSYVLPEPDLLVGKASISDQFGILGESIHGKKVAIDLSETNTISLFGVQGGGKSYTIGTISEMVLKQFSKVNKLPSPLAGVIFHYSESMDYKPEFTSMIYPNDQVGELRKLKDHYGAEPDNIEDVIILTPRDKMEERKAEYPTIEVLPIAFNSKELNVQDWMFILGAIGNDSAYIKQLKAIMKEHRKNITINGISESVEASELLSTSQKALARQKLSFAREYIDDLGMLRDSLKPGRLIIVDLRDEFVTKDEALGLFVIMLNIFSAVKNIKDKHFNKFIVFDEAHKYMDNKDLTGNIVTAVREMRHKGVSIMIASQDPPSLPNEIIELSSIVLLHKFNSPQWLKHIQKSITQLSTLSPADMSSLTPGEGFLWSTKATEKSVSVKPMKISTRPRVTKHGGGTVQATSDK